jgi:hypothetical protein
VLPSEVGRKGQAPPLVWERELRTT